MSNLEKTIRSGRANLTERLIIKSFKTPEAMHKFLCGPENIDNEWHASTKNLKAGTYAFAGGQWHNIKTLDACMLAHI